MIQATTDKVKQFFLAYPAKTYTKGEIIIQADENPPGVFSIVTGLVSQYDISGRGDLIVLNIYKAPGFFPMAWAINSMPNRYFFEAKTNVTLHLAPADETMAFLRESPDVMYDMLQRMYLAGEALLRRTAHLMAGDARTRLHFELINDGYRFGELQRDGTIFVPMKENDLAAQTGLARETVSRNLKTLKKAGLVEVTHQGFIIRDFVRFEAELGRNL